MANKSNQPRHRSWWQLGDYRPYTQPCLSLVGQTELKKIKAILGMEARHDKR